MDQEREDLYTPSLEGQRTRQVSDARPWRLGSQFYIAFFGGPLGVGAIAFLNSQRLLQPLKSQILIILCALAGIAGGIAAVLIGDLDANPLIFRLAGVISWGGMFLVQRGADRHFAIFTADDGEDQYEPLWGPGIGASIAGLIISGIILSAVAS